MKIKIFTVAFAFLIMASFQVNAGEVMTGKEIKTLITGKTVQAEHLKKGFTFTVYFAADGSAIRKKNGDNIDGTYTIKDNKHCVNFGNGDKCATILPNGGGTYIRLKNGNSNKGFIKWSKIVDGKHL